MRYLQIVAVIFLVFSLLFAGWANNRYYSSLNTDYPTISNSLELLEISVNDPPEMLLEGLSARDATDGDLTGQIMVASASHFLEPGTVNIKYVVFDSHNNSATLTRKVHYVDYTSPVFSLEKAPVYTVGSAFDLLDYIKVIDCIDGDISNNIRVISNTVNTFSEGDFPIVLEVSNSCGDMAQITIRVTYRNTENTANIKLHGHIVYVSQGDTFDPMEQVSSVKAQNGVTLSQQSIEVQGSLNTKKPGCYQLVYSYNDGKHSGQTPLTVVVTERQA